MRGFMKQTSLVTAVSSRCFTESLGGEENYDEIKLHYK